MTALFYTILLDNECAGLSCLEPNADPLGLRSARTKIIAFAIVKVSRLAVYTCDLESLLGNINLYSIAEFLNIAENFNYYLVVLLVGSDNNVDLRSFLYLDLAAVDPDLGTVGESIGIELISSSHLSNSSGCEGYSVTRNLYYEIRCYIGRIDYAVSLGRVNCSAAGRSTYNTIIRIRSA